MEAKLSTVATAKSLQLCPTLCEPIDGSPPGSPVPGILQERTLEWGAIASSDVELGYDEITACQILWETAKTEFRGNFLAQNKFLGNKKC